jgi:hypothetical protein
MALMHLWRRPTGSATADLHFYLGVRADQNQCCNAPPHPRNRGPEIGASRAPERTLHRFNRDPADPDGSWGISSSSPVSGRPEDLHGVGAPVGQISGVAAGVLVSLRVRFACVG